MYVHLEYGGGLPPACLRVHIEPARHGGQAVPAVLHYQPPALLTIGSWVSILTILTILTMSPLTWTLPLATTASPPASREPHMPKVP